jgi:single-strand DNA-binding protein
MAFSLNKIQIIGTLGQDAETRFTTNNKCVSSFSVATTDGYKGKDGNYVNETTWHNVVAWEQSEFIKALLTKGAKFYVEGKLKKRDYTDKEGVKKYITEIVARELIPLDKNERPQHGHSTEQNGSSDTQQQNVPSSEDDDLPF